MGAALRGGAVAEPRRTQVRVVTSATAAIEVALAVAGVGPGDEVVMPAQTFFASMNTVVRARRPAGVRRLRARHPQHRSIEASARDHAAHARAAADVLAGSLPDPDALHALAREHGLRVIEDAALAQGSHRRGRPVGSFGDLAVLSFHPNKNMTSIEGGATRAERGTRSGARRGAALPRHRAPPRRHARRDVAGRQVQPARRQRPPRLRAARAACPVPRATPRRSSSATSRVSPTTWASSCRRGPRATTRPQLEHVLRAAAARPRCDHRAGVPRRNSTRTASPAACPTRRCTSPPSAAPRRREGQFPVPSASRARRSRCRCTRACTTPTSTACARPARASAQAARG